MIAPIKGVHMRLPKQMEVTREKSRQLGPLLRGMHPVVPDNGWHNTVAAFRKRCNYHSAARASLAIVDAAQKFTNKVVPKTLKTFEWSEKLYKEWREKFGPEKQSRMDNSLNGLCEAQLKDYSRKDIFVKIEALLVTHKPNWAPRIIFKGTDLYNAISGPIFNELMRRFDLGLDSMEGNWRFKSSYKKTPCQYVPHLEKREDGEFWVEADFSSNDKFQCSDVQIIEVAFMRALGCPEWFVRLHMKTNQFTVKSKHGISARLENQLPTGATDTTFRNTLWNGCILWAFLRKVKADSCRAMLMGDDMLACIKGVCSYAVKIYTSVASEAQMEAKVVRHNNLWTATFLSRFFVPHLNCQHLTVPILGKAIGRFNMRANKNEAVSDHRYMASKSVGYAYEFRYFPVIRDIFLVRFKYEFSFLSAKEKDNLEIDVTWNSKAAGVTLKNITKKLVVDNYLSEYEFHCFCWERYHLFGNDVLDLFRDVVNCDQKIDLEGVVVSKLARDFL